jgi:hypothetical protein
MSIEIWNAIGIEPRAIIPSRLWSPGLHTRRGLVHKPDE